MKYKVDFCLQLNIKGFLKLILSFSCVWPDMSILPKITSLLFFCNILRKTWVMKLIFCMQISMKVSYKLILWYLMGWSRVLKVPKIASLQCLYKYLKKEVRDEVDFLHADKHQSFLQVNFNTFGIKISYKVILSLLMNLIKHSQSTQSNKFGKSLQYLKNKVRDGVHFLHLHKHQSFYKLALLFWWKWPGMSKGSVIFL